MTPAGRSVGGERLKKNKKCPEWDITIRKQILKNFNNV